MNVGRLGGGGNRALGATGHQHHFGGHCVDTNVEQEVWQDKSKSMSSHVISFPFSAAGCTFEEDSDPSLCDFTQGEEDDFDWLLFRTYGSPYASSDLLRGE